VRIFSLNPLLHYWTAYIFLYQVYNSIVILILRYLRLINQIWGLFHRFQIDFVISYNSLQMQFSFIILCQLFFQNRKIGFKSNGWKIFRNKFEAIVHQHFQLVYCLSVIRKVKISNIVDHALVYNLIHNFD
jgi:hypothetical protein